jgi:hypothetical protein
MVPGAKSREERWSLTGATALVTGGSKGIGYVIKITSITYMVDV